MYVTPASSQSSGGASGPAANGAAPGPPATVSCRPWPTSRLDRAPHAASARAEAPKQTSQVFTGAMVPVARRLVNRGAPSDRERVVLLAFRVGERHDARGVDLKAEGEDGVEV